MPSPARFDQDEPVTVLATARAAGGGDGIWDGHPSPVIALQLTLGGRIVVLPLASPDVTVIHGDIRPTLIQALRDAIAYHDDGRCGDTDHLGWTENYERALDVLAPSPLASVR